MKRIILCVCTFFSLSYPSIKKTSLTTHTFKPNFLVLPKEIQKIILLSALENPSKNPTTIKKRYRTFCSLRTTHTQIRDFLYRESWKLTDLEIFRLIHDVCTERFGTTFTDEDYKQNTRVDCLKKLSGNATLTSEETKVIFDREDYKLANLTLLLNKIPNETLPDVVLKSCKNCWPKLLTRIPNVEEYINNSPHKEIIYINSECEYQLVTPLSLACTHLTNPYSKCHKKNKANPRCRWRMMQTIQFLIANGANLAPDIDHTPLVRAADSNDYELIRFLLEHENYKIPPKPEEYFRYSKRMFTALCYILKNKNQKAFELFLKHKNKLGKNTLEKALVYAAEEGYTDFALILFQHAGPINLFENKYLFKAIKKASTQTGPHLLRCLFEFMNNHTYIDGKITKR